MKFKSKGNYTKIKIIRKQYEINSTCVILTIKLLNAEKSMCYYMEASSVPVSYTHLDVYKRQSLDKSVI